MTSLRPSLLRLSAGRRVVYALAMVLLIWLLVFWAIS